MKAIIDFLMVIGVVLLYFAVCFTLGTMWTLFAPSGEESEEHHA